MELHSISMIKGFMVGVECEELDNEDYIILSLGFIQIIWVG